MFRADWQFNYQEGPKVSDLGLDLVAKDAFSGGCRAYSRALSFNSHVPGCSRSEQSPCGGMRRVSQ